MAISGFFRFHLFFKAVFRIVTSSSGSVPSRQAHPTSKNHSTSRRLSSARCTFVCFIDTNFQRKQYALMMKNDFCKFQFFLVSGCCETHKQLVFGTSCDRILSIFWRCRRGIKNRLQKGQTLTNQRSKHHASLQFIDRVWATITFESQPKDDNDIIMIHYCQKVVFWRSSELRSPCCNQKRTSRTTTFPFCSAFTTRIHASSERQVPFLLQMAAQNIIINTRNVSGVQQESTCSWFSAENFLDACFSTSSPYKFKSNIFFFRNFVISIQWFDASRYIRQDISGKFGFSDLNLSPLSAAPFTLPPRLFDSSTQSNTLFLFICSYYASRCEKSSPLVVGEESRVFAKVYAALLTSFHTFLTLSLSSSSFLYRFLLSFSASFVVVVDFDFDFDYSVL